MQYLSVIALALHPEQVATITVNADSSALEVGKVTREVARVAEAPLALDKLSRQGQVVATGSDTAFAQGAAAFVPAVPLMRAATWDQSLVIRAFFGSLCAAGFWLVPVRSVHVVASSGPARQPVTVVTSGIPGVELMAAAAAVLLQVVFVLTLRCGEKWVLWAYLPAAGVNAALHQRLAWPWAKGSRGASIASAAVAALATSSLLGLSLANPEVDLWLFAPGPQLSSLQLILLPQLAGVLQLSLLASLTGLSASLSQLLDVGDGKHARQVSTSLLGLAAGICAAALRSHTLVATVVDAVLVVATLALVVGTTQLPSATAGGNHGSPPPAAVQLCGLAVLTTYALLVAQQVLDAPAAAVLLAAATALVVPPTLNAALACPCAAVFYLAGVYSHSASAATVGLAAMLGTGGAIAARAQAHSASCSWVLALVGGLRGVQGLAPLVNAKQEVAVGLATALAAGGIFLIEAERRSRLPRQRKHGRN